MIKEREADGENVVSAAAAPHRFTSNGIKEVISEVGFEQQLSNQKYEYREMPEMINSR